MSLQVIEEPKRRGRPSKVIVNDGQHIVVPPTEETTLVIESVAVIERYRMQLDPVFDNWLLTELETRKPWYSRAGWFGQIRQALGSNDFMALKLNNSIFLGAVHKDPLDPRVRIQEFICWTMDEKWYDCMKLYREVRRKSHDMNAVCINLLRDSCVPPNEVERQLSGQYPGDMFVDMTK